ncbi:MAG: hypothetical protein IPK13_19340 [Deltaproteobacteria bacterium]|nr:hypothetical protein [Deltaproteobacteria bacterium]
MRTRVSAVAFVAVIPGLLALFSGGCTRDTASTAPEAGPTSTTSKATRPQRESPEGNTSQAAAPTELSRADFPEFGFSMRYPTSWAPSSLTTLPKGTASRTLAELRRRPPTRGFQVVPRIIITVEPAKVEELNAAVGLVLSEVAQVSQAPGTRLGRTEVGRRKLSSTTVATLETTYSVARPRPSSGETRARARGSSASSGPKNGARGDIVAESGTEPETVVQRSIVALVRDSGATLQLLTVTATYLMKDAAIVGEEINGVLGSIRLDPIGEPVRKQKSRRASRPPSKEGP